MIKDVGKFKTFKREIDLNADTKRFWPEKIRTIHSDSCVESMPLDVNLDGRLYSRWKVILFYAEQDDYNPYDSVG